jgi:carbon monoxide dehydrogenase subunit G
MAVKVSINISREFSVDADYDSVFALLSDVEASAQHFPKVEQLTDLGNDTFRWEMEKVGLGDHAIQTIYASTYSSDEEAGTVNWTPVKGEGNGLVSGGWVIEEAEGGTNLTLETSAELNLPLPGLLKLAISPVVKAEFSGMVDTYVSNLSEHFSA